MTYRASTVCLASMHSMRSHCMPVEAFVLRLAPDRTHCCLHQPCQFPESSCPAARTKLSPQVCCGASFSRLTCHALQMSVAAVAHPPSLSLQCAWLVAWASESSPAARSTAWVHRACATPSSASLPALSSSQVAAAGMIIDMRYMNTVVYNPDDQSATCGSGATWRDVIFATNAFGRSPRTLQS